MKKNAAPTEAERIATMRRTLMLESNEVRLGDARDPETTACRLTAVALALMESDATDFEKVSTLNIAHANLLGGGLQEAAVREIASLSLQALHIAYPRSTERDENHVRLTAIKGTSPEQSFPQAYEEAWERAGRPLEPILVETELLALASIEENLRQSKANEVTGPLDPFIEDAVPAIPTPRKSIEAPSYA